MTYFILLSLYALIIIIIIIYTYFRYLKSSQSFHNQRKNHSQLIRLTIKSHISSQLITMQADTYKTKKRCYNYFLRHFHMGLRILAVIFSTRIILDHQTCSPMIDKFVFPLTLILTTLNLFFIVYFQCHPSFPRCQFFFFLSINIILCSCIALLTYSYFSDNYHCRKTMILQSYIVLEVIFCVPICLVILSRKFQWQQRYTNSPGNVIWAVVIMQFAHDMEFVLQIQIVEWVTTVISTATLVINTISIVSGITPCIKKSIFIQWIMALSLIILCILLAIIMLLSNYNINKPANEILSNICLKYILVSIIDIGFWMWGLLTLTYENGDYIHNAIIYGSYSGDWKEKTQINIEQYVEQQQQISIKKQSHLTL